MKKGSVVILSIIAAVAVIGLAFVLTSPIQSPTGGIPGSGQIIPAFKVAICHKGTTLFVAPGAVPGHQAHGDALGTCGAPTPTQPEPTNTPVEPTETPEPTDTPQPTSTPTQPIPTNTPTQTPQEPTPTDTFTPNPTGTPF